MEIVYPHTLVVLGGESFRVPLRWRHWFCEGYEQPTFDFIHTYCMPGATLIDIGAHFGIFTISALRRVGSSGKVIAFEPCGATRSVLLQILELNGFSGIPEIREEAVWNVSGQSGFFSSNFPGDAGNSLIGDIQHPVRFDVRTVRLDDIPHSRVDAIKIDAEGAELQILDGSRALIMNHRPAVLLSVHPLQIKRSGKSLGELWDIMESLKLFAIFLITNSFLLESLCSQTELFDVCLKAHPFNRFFQIHSLAFGTCVIEIEKWDLSASTNLALKPPRDRHRSSGFPTFLHSKPTG